MTCGLNLQACTGPSGAPSRSSIRALTAVTLCFARPPSVLLTVTQTAALRWFASVSHAKCSSNVPKAVRERLVLLAERSRLSSEVWNWSCVSSGASMRRKRRTSSRSNGCPETSTDFANWADFDGIFICLNAS
jgi:hypothetical protein